MSSDGSFSLIFPTNTGEVNFKLENKDDCIASLLEHFKEENPAKILSFDGYRIEFPDWWFSVRKSNTEPYLRIVCEAKDAILLKEKMDEISSIIHRFN